MAPDPDPVSLLTLKLSRRSSVAPLVVEKRALRLKATVHVRPRRRRVRRSGFPPLSSAWSRVSVSGHGYEKLLRPSPFVGLTNNPASV